MEASNDGRGESIGIDLGTTNTVIARAREGRSPDVMLSSHQERYIPSAFLEDKAGRKYVGKSAYTQAIRDSANYIYSVKRLMGRHMSDAEVQKVKATLSYRVVSPPEDPNSDEVRVVSGNTAYSPIQISAEILKRAKEDAEKKLNVPVTHAVITVPAYFTDVQKAATREAAHLAGLKVSRILEEPTAAALAFGLDLDPEEDHEVLVYDLGGGTFDVSVISINNGIPLVSGYTGDMWLGGNVFDELLMNHVLEKIERKRPGNRARLLADPQAHWKLREKAEEVKKILSDAKVATFDVAGLLDNSLDIEEEITQLEFENLIRPYVQETIDLLDRALEKAGGIGREEITDVLLVGGSSAVPLVQRMLIREFGQEKIRSNVNAMECVAMGAALQARIRDVVLCSLGHSNDDTATQCRECGEKLDPNDGRGVFQQCPECKKLNERHAIVCECGTALNAGAPVAQPYGIGLDDDKYKIIIPEGTRWPMTDPVEQEFVTVDDNQPFIKIPVYQGEEMDRASANSWQGNVVVGIPEEKRGPAGLPARVGMQIDQNGILTVSVTGVRELKGVNISVRLEREAHVTTCACGHRNPGDAYVCASCGKELGGTVPPQQQVCPNCSQRCERSATVCPTCGETLKPVTGDPANEPEEVMDCGMQMVTAEIAVDSLDFLLTADMKRKLENLNRQARPAVEKKDVAACARLSKEYRSVWENASGIQDLAFARLVSQSGRGSLQDRQELAGAFTELESAAHRNDVQRMKSLTSKIFALVKRIIDDLDNIVCPHCKEMTKPGVRCEHCKRPIRSGGGLGQKK